MFYTYTGNRNRLQNLSIAGILVLLLMSPSILYSDATESGITKHYEHSLFATTATGIYGVELLIVGHTLSTGNNVIEFIIHDRDDRDVSDAEIGVTAEMVDDNHHLVNKPIILEWGEGLYRVEDILLDKPGHWKLNISIRKGENKDIATFDFPDIKERDINAGKNTSTATIDTSTTQISKKNLFIVSYAYETDPVLVGNYVKLKLRVMSTTERPIDDAWIKISGDMPAHGHGMPTQPEVTEELGNGYYIIDGIKYSMPGHWTISMQITSQGQKDNVTFNLFVK